MIDFAMLLVYTAPLALAALGELINQKSGLINIGLEGAMLVGAYFGAMAGIDSGSALIGLTAGTLSGLALCLIQGAFTIRMAQDQVVVGLATNLLALGLTSTLYRARFGNSGKLLYTPHLAGIAGIDLITVLAILLVPALHWLFYRTGWGLATRASGERPESLAAAGWSVAKIRWLSLLFSGLLAGLSGAYLAIGVANSFSENMTGGRGFVAIALVTFGRWKPIGVALAALLVGLTETLQFGLQASRMQVPHQLLTALPYLVALGVLIVAGKGQNAPDALGRPYRA